MFEPPVAGNLKLSGDVKMEPRLRSRYRSPPKTRTEGGGGRSAGVRCVKVVQAAADQLWVHQLQKEEVFTSRIITEVICSSPK